MRMRLSRGSGDKHKTIVDTGENTMSENEVMELDEHQQLFEFMLEMPQLYGYESDHFTSAERGALAQSQTLVSERVEQ